MLLQSVSPLSFKAVDKNENKNNTAVVETTQNNDKNNNSKKKIILALGALAAAGVAGVAIASRIHKKGVAPDEKVVNETVEKIKGLKQTSEPVEVNSKDTIIKFLDSKNEPSAAIKNTYAKYDGIYDGKNVNVELKYISSPIVKKPTSYYAVIRDAETDKLVAMKPIGMDGADYSSTYRHEPVHRVTSKTTTETGKEVFTTTKNNKKFAKRTTEFDEQGNKIITVTYNSGNIKTITISPDGKRDVANSQKFIKL